jgi:hypothetical protein
MPEDGVIPIGDSFIMITNCCCGLYHVVPVHRWRQYKRVSAGHPPTVTVTLEDDRSIGYQVPRRFILCHRVTGRDVPWLADLYNWETVRHDLSED